MKTLKSFLSEAGVLDKKTYSVEQIAKKHKVSVDTILKQLKMGVNVEKEHTSSHDAANEIARDHLWEVPNYYTKLKSVE